MSNIYKQNFSNNLSLGNKYPRSLKALNIYRRESWGHLFLTIKYLVSETMLPGADTIWFHCKALWTNASGLSCRCRGQVLQMLSPSCDPGTAGASGRLETLFVKASPAPCKQGDQWSANAFLNFSFHNFSWRGWGSGGWESDYLIPEHRVLQKRKKINHAKT